MFWRFHKECQVQNPLEVLSDAEDVVRYLEGSRLKQSLPALLLLDLRIPRMGGLQLLEYLRATGQREFRTVLLIQPNDHDLNLVAAAYRLGVDAFLMKPLERKEFCSVISQVHGVAMDCCAEPEAVSPSNQSPERSGSFPRLSEISAPPVDGHS